MTGNASLTADWHARAVRAEAALKDIKRLVDEGPRYDDAAGYAFVLHQIEERLAGTVPDLLDEVERLRKALGDIKQVLDGPGYASHLDAIEQIIEETFRS